MKHRIGCSSRRRSGQLDRSPRGGSTSRRPPSRWPARPARRSIAAVLSADGTRPDKNWKDFDITEAAVLAVLGAKPDSAVGLLTQGNKRATVFVPTDAAFRSLVRDRHRHRHRRPRPRLSTPLPRWAWTRSRPSCSTTSSRARR